MSAKDILLQWIAAFNEANVEKLSALYHEDAVNHQVANEPVIGKKAIEDMFRQEFAQATMVCQPENIFEDGEWAIMEWKDPLGMRGCGFFHVRENQIIFQRGYWDKLTFQKLQGFH